MRHLLSLALAATLTTPIHAEDSMTDHDAVLATITQMTDAFADGDLDGIMQTYTPEAMVVAQPGAPVGGDAPLRAMFDQFISAGVNFEYGDHEVVVAGDTALHLMQWTAPGPDGPTTALSVAVLERQDDNGWRMVIDHPFGDHVMNR